MNEEMVRMETVKHRPTAREWQNQIPPALLDDVAFCALNPIERLLFLTMIIKADRYGRGVARTAMLRVAAFDGLGVTDDQTEAMIQDLPGLTDGSQFELVVYEVDGGRFYAFRRWFEWQNTDYLPRESRYTAPPLPEEPA
jgi:hypothetical protein